MGKKEPGTTLQDPTGVDWRPDLAKSCYDINEYLRDQNAYDLFATMLTELVTQQPQDPIDHMLKFLKTPCDALGPLRVIISRAPGTGTSAIAKRLAQHFGLEYISAGELLADKQISFAEDSHVAGLVMERVKRATEQMKGYVLEGFPRTRMQATFLKENSIVPTHVLVLKSSAEQIQERHRRIGNGELEGTYLTPEVLEYKLRMHTCHISAALEAYQDKIATIDTTVIDDAEAIFADMVKGVCRMPRSRAPKLPPRVIMLGPRGTGAREHAKRLAAHLGAVLVDGTKLLREQEQRERESTASAKVKGQSAQHDQLNNVGREPLAVMELPNTTSLMAKDQLGLVGVRLRQVDCTRAGWVLVNFPTSPEMAKYMANDDSLCPVRVVALRATEETCKERLRNTFVDPVSGEVWTTMPESSEIRRRLQRRPEDEPEYISARCQEYASYIDKVLEAFNSGRSCLQIQADSKSLETVYTELAEFVDRPLPLQGFELK
jgi:adenylate kinase